MISERLRKRLRDKDRPMTEVTVRVPVDVLDDLKAVAGVLGFSGHTALICMYTLRGCVRM